MLNLRRIAEILLRDIVVKRRLPSTFDSAAMFMSTAGGLKMIVKAVRDIDPDLLRAVSSLVVPGDTVWDIGANVGLFAIAAAVRAGTKGQVVCFEPDTKLIELLRRNAALHGSKFAEITVVNAAIARSTSLRRFHISSRARAANALSDYGSANMGTIAETQIVVALSVEDALKWLPAPNVVKIDVEGAEGEIINKHSTLLCDIRPVIHCEVHDANIEEIRFTMKMVDYLLFDAAKYPSDNSRIESPTFNTIAIPRERERDFVTSPPGRPLL